MPDPDPLLSCAFYDRTSEEQSTLGFLSQPSEDHATIAGGVNPPETMGRSAEGETGKYQPAGTTRLPHGSVGALGAHHAIAEGNSSEMAAAIFKYSAPEEVCIFCLFGCG